MKRPHFPAKYPGACRNCGDDINPGDNITGASGQGYRHFTCKKDIPRDRSPQSDLPIDWERVAFPPGTLAKSG